MTQRICLTSHFQSVHLNYFLKSSNKRLLVTSNSFLPSSVFLTKLNRIFRFNLRTIVSSEISDMAIEWAPWFNVPLHRRLEVLAVAFQIFCGYFSGLFVTIAIIYFLVKKYHLELDEI